MASIYFGTNRNPSPKKNPTRFSKTFGEDSLSNLRFGKANVTGKEFKSSRTVKISSRQRDCRDRP